MTLWDLIYWIGYGVAFLMCAIGLTIMAKKDENADNFLPVIFGALFGGLLSWGIPIWWIGYQFYTRKILK